MFWNILSMLTVQLLLFPLCISVLPSIGIELLYHQFTNFTPPRHSDRIKPISILKCIFEYNGTIKNNLHLPYHSEHLLKFLNFNDGKRMTYFKISFPTTWQLGGHWFCFPGYPVTVK